MPSIFDKLKEGADKAAFEADRLRRLNQAQGTLRTLQRQLEAQTAALGQQALALYDAGALTQPELLATCQQQIDALRRRIADQEAEIERIRQERPPVPAVPALYGHICPRCQIQLPAGAGFCPRCGSPAMDVAPPPPGAGKPCACCGAMLAAEALFCGHCGAPVEAAAPSPAPTLACPSCHTPIPAEAGFCPECGAPIAPTPAEPAAEEVVPEPIPSRALSEAEGEIEGVMAAPGQILCPTCRASIPAEAVFCPECSAAIAAPLVESTGEEVVSEAEPTLEEAPGRATCPTCHTSIPAEAVFCPECGAPMAALPPEPAREETPPGPVPSEIEGVAAAPARIACPTCRASIPAEAVFCPECGAPVAPAPAGWE